MANPQTENGFLQIANDIWNEVIRRDFSKRQKDIILFIWRLSYGCKKKTAFIPMLKDFELCGVGYSNITNELKYLVQMRVIDWDREHTTFTVNKDYERWQVSPVRGWDEERFKQLVHQNIEKKTYQNDKPKTQKSSPEVIVTYQNNKLALIKTISWHLSKREVNRGQIAFRSKVERVSKESIKEIIKETQEEETAMDAYIFSFKKIMYTGHIQGYVSELMKRGLTDSFIREVFLEMGARGIGPDERYMRKLAEDWILKGVFTREAAQKLRDSQKSREFPQRGYSRDGNKKPSLAVVEDKGPTKTITPDERERMRELARKLRDGEPELSVRGSASGTS